VQVLRRGGGLVFANSALGALDGRADAATPSDGDLAQIETIVLGAYLGAIESVDTALDRFES
jgi:hypothetical protein